MIKKLVKTIISEKTYLEVYYKYCKFKSIFYKGNRFYCICCENSFRKLLPNGNIQRKNAVCPYCLSLERTRLLMYYLQNETQVFNEKMKVLHFAPEKAIEDNIRSYNKTNYITADINPTFADTVVDIQDIPFENNKFDLIICSHVLGHVPNEPKAIDEVYRVLANGGTALFLTVIDLTKATTYENKDVNTDEDRLIHYGESDLLRLHGMDFSSRLQRDNVKVENTDYSINFTDFEKSKYQLGNQERELIFVCRKLVQSLTQDA